MGMAGRLLGADSSFVFCTCWERWHLDAEEPNPVPAMALLCHQRGQ